MARVYRTRCSLCGQRMNTDYRVFAIRRPRHPPRDEETVGVWHPKCWELIMYAVLRALQAKTPTSRGPGG